MNTFLRIPGKTTIISPISLFLQVEILVIQYNLLYGNMIYVSRKEHFNAAHKLYNPNWSKEKNQEIFGACANENWHGHNFDVTVTVKGAPDPDTGFVMNFKDLKRIVNEEIIDQVDHKNLNLDVEFFKDRLVTCEIMIVEFWNRLAPKIAEVTDGRASLHYMKLTETANNFAEYYGE